MGNIVFDEQTAASVSTPASGKNAAFFDSAEGAFKVKDDTGTSRTSDNTVYRTLFHASARTAVDQAAATYLFSQGVGTTADNGNHAVVTYVPTVYIDDADFGASPKFRVRAQLFCNATAPGTITYTFGLYPVDAVAGGTDIMTYDIGTVVTSSTAAQVNPAASTRYNLVSSDFACPADGHYTFGVVTTATLANNAAASFSAQLQIRNA